MCAGQVEVKKSGMQSHHHVHMPDEMAAWLRVGKESCHDLESAWAVAEKNGSPSLRLVGCPIIDDCQISSLRIRSGRRWRHRKASACGQGRAGASVNRRCIA